MDRRTTHIQVRAASQWAASLRKLLFAIQYQEQRIVLSSLINSESKILYNRSPRDRVAKVAPWLTLDGDPYPAIVDGKINGLSMDTQLALDTHIHRPQHLVQQQQML